MKIDCTFETKCWENDYKLMLQTSHLKNMISNCNVDFMSHQLIINNVKDENKVKKMAQNLIDMNIIDTLYCVSDYAEKVLSTYNIDDNFFGGYNYSIAEVVGIYNCKTKYLLHFSSDSYIPYDFKNSQWIIEAIEIMENNSDIIVANPVWNYRWNEAKKESMCEIDEFYKGYGFSDQCYLINTDIFKGDIYNFKHQDSERYPKYGGELFEKRIDAYMRNNSKYRITHKNTSYVSKNITSLQYFFEKIGIKKI